MGTLDWDTSHARGLNQPARLGHEQGDEHVRHVPFERRGLQPAARLGHEQGDEHAATFWQANRLQLSRSRLGHEQGGGHGAASSAGATSVAAAVSPRSRRRGAVSSTSAHRRLGRSPRDDFKGRRPRRVATSDVAARAARDGMNTLNGRLGFGRSLAFSGREAAGRRRRQANGHCERRSRAGTCRASTTWSLLRWEEQASTSATSAPGIRAR